MTLVYINTASIPNKQQKNCDESVLICFFVKQSTKNNGRKNQQRYAKRKTHTHC